MLIAGGGTGGHLFPGMAVAEEFMGRGPGHRVLFVGTARGIEARLLPEAGHEFAAIRSRGIAGMGIVGKLRGALTLPLSLLDAARVVRSFKPHAALGVGGYVSGPAILAARLLGVPCAIQEQNAAPGFTNRILARLAQKVFVSFEPARKWFASADRKGRLTVAGNPVRRKIVEALLAGKEGQERVETGSGKVRLLVTGGSQGAHGLNLLTLDAVAALDPQTRGRLLVRHQAGERDLDMVTARYRELGVEARVEPFIKDMAAAYLEADLAAARSGAGAVAEIALAGLPAILVPYPFAASDHQAVNASVLADAGAALMFREGEADGATVAKALAGIINDAGKRRAMADRARAAARPEAARVIVDQCLEMIGQAFC
jgi:UDP-N-acetylglucosamine--N-acetylmuramyl-(pentapeptide) pyrophosphoryl-undecaprenol N-acetylglucosamine transferase